jgi:hypothetical protein
MAGRVPCGRARRFGGWDRRLLHGRIMSVKPHDSQSSPPPVPRSSSHERAPAFPTEAGFGATLRRRIRDLMIMGVVGPVTGVLAIVVLHFATAIPPVDPALIARAAVESERALAALEDRPMATASLPRFAKPVVPDIPVVAPEAPSPPELTAADFGSAQPTPAARRMADWIVARHDNGKLPFMVLDKRDARLYVFEPSGELVDHTPVLLGSSHGDDTFPGIGDVPISKVKPYQRTTAAGRFVTKPGLDADRTDVVWLDYDAALAMHRVINKVKSEHRLQRIASPNPAVRRISWGCINIPIAFFDRHISPVFGKQSGVAYVIPERKTFAEVFERSGGAAPVVAALDSKPMAPKDVGDR